MTASADDERMRFDVIRASATQGTAARLGRLALPQRKAIDTPDFVAVTSRGAVPHITPDNLSRHVNAAGAYIALEDFIERSQVNPGRVPPIYKMPPAPQSKPLHAFTVMPPSTITVLGARRFPAVASPLGNSQGSISVFTSTGFQNLTTAAYEAAVEALKPDVAIPLADLPNASVTPKSKRAQRMVERTDEWLAQWLRHLDPATLLRPSSVSVFAPLLPVSYPVQWDYLNRLSEDYLEHLSGLAIYGTEILPHLKDYENLLLLPRLSLDEPRSPHDILRQISLGVDLFLVPFINNASDSGVALTFAFPPPATTSTDATATFTTRLPLGVDMSAEEHQTSLAPLREGCTCYACTRHHRAYVRHLLHAREMLGWTLLQLHNHRVLADFFSGVRASLSSSSSSSEFETERARFAEVYDDVLPTGSGERPRARGYHFKSEAGEKRRNKPAWAKFAADEPVVLGSVGESDTGSANGCVREPAETPVAPEESAAEWDRKSFAEMNGNVR
ncbi:hypothetical protein VTK73DRAFT_8847 [Phialemonium thermophilum]|uniref:Queuine tRNA-ribosyltransferase accessory subunit 2 n=1 Tax=Phialemonium thermophilum TaxID=223376 RepID=A0ABR3XN04_9PEZI